MDWALPSGKVQEDFALNVMTLVDKAGEALPLDECG